MQAQTKVWLTEDSKIAVLELHADGRSEGKIFTEAEWDLLVQQVAQLRTTGLRGFRPAAA